MCGPDGFRHFAAEREKQRDTAVDIGAGGDVAGIEIGSGCKIGLCI